MVNRLVIFSLLIICTMAGQTQKLSQSLTLSVLSDFIRSEVYEGEGIIGFNANTGEPITKKTYYQSSSLNIFTVGYQSTLEITPSIIITSPISLGVGLTQPTDEDLNYVNGLGSIKIPLFFALRSNQPKENTFIEVGVGYQWSFFPMLNLDAEVSADQTHLMPMGYLRALIAQNKRPIEVGFKLGLGAIQSYAIDIKGKPLIDSNGNRIEKNSRALNAQLWFGFPIQKD